MVATQLFEVASHANGDRHWVLATCKIAGAESWAYLRDVLPELARRWPEADVEDLLPHRWVGRHKAALAETVLGTAA